MNAEIPLQEFDAVGIDGVLLRAISGGALSHTSADHSMPSWLEGKAVTVGLLGGDSRSAEAHFSDFCLHFPSASILWSIPGDDSCLEKVSTEISRTSQVPELILVGMGAPLQEKVATELKRIIEKEFPEVESLIATCGGWLDQLGVKNYYPAWSTPLRLNWLIRLSREPRRLWKRYFVFSIVALIQRKAIKRYLANIRTFIG